MRQYVHKTGPLTEANIEGIFSLLKGTTQDKRMRAYYDMYKEAGWINDVMDHRQFIEEMMYVKHMYDENYLQFAAAAARAKKPIKREILKAVRFEGKDGKEYIRFSAKFSSENKHGEPIETSTQPIGVWEQPIPKKKYHPEIEEYVTDPSIISHTIPHYEYEWKPEVVKELSKEFTRETSFFITDTNNARKFTVDRETWMIEPRAPIIEREHEAWLAAAKAKVR